MMAMPDGLHMTSKDCVASVFFAVQLFVPTGYEEEQSLVRETFYGAAIYAQIPSDSVVDASADVTRNFVQKSCCLMSRQPIFGWLVEKLQATASLYFDQRNFSNRTVLENLMDGLLSNTQSIPASLDFAQSLPIRCMVDILGDRLLICMKVLLLARPLIVLSRSATTSSSFSVALASLFPLTISSLADGSIAHQSSASFDRKACYLSVKLRSHYFTSILQVMHAAFKRCDHADVETMGQDNTMLSLKHFGFPLAVLGNKKLIRPTNQVILLQRMETSARSL
jgi:hypothetical protein